MASMHSPDLQIARQSCRERYAKYAGDRPNSGLAYARMHQLLREGKEQLRQEQKIAVRAFFARKLCTLGEMLAEAESCRTEEGLHAIGNDMVNVSLSMETTEVGRMMDAPLYHFLKAAEAFREKGATWVQAFLDDLFPAGKLVVKAGLQDADRLPVVLEGGSVAEPAGFLAIHSRSFPVSELASAKSDALFAFPFLPATLEYSADGNLVKVGVLEMNVFLSGSQAGYPSEVFNGLMYYAEQDFSKARRHAEDFLLGHEQDQNRAKRALSSPKYSFSLRTPQEDEARSLHLEASATYAASEGFQEGASYAITVVMPGSRLYGEAFLPGSGCRKAVLKDCASNNVGC